MEYGNEERMTDGGIKRGGQSVLKWKKNKINKKRNSFQG